MAAIDVVQQTYRAFADNDGANLGRLLGDTRWVEARGGPYGGTYTGLAEVGPHVFSRIGEDVRQFTAIPDEMLSIGEDRVLALGHYRGMSRNGPVGIRFGHLWTVEGERIAHFEQFTDTHEWQRAVTE